MNLVGDGWRVGGRCAFDFRSSKSCWSGSFQTSTRPSCTWVRPPPAEREFFIDNLLVRIHFGIVMIRWTGLAPWEIEFPCQGGLTSTVLESFDGHPDALLDKNRP